ncbi:MFS transporter, DHA1 family, purine base/nucleoside efflux pump [Salinibacillus kushneri]|uniref:MFS transporter, DHA1 family, purine base/nucleoside efflux pump n=1 Tax=Salinibacillus kushneri TaxID=237682 RepID=A0A1I0IGQ0_9BACI|nr:MFS transporter [Salinibacillus kushneri]SET96111.1 MFS transporter, DHA1 family, purine base/nucleoside efflux pump [Salinibacillus kushneri]
MDKRVYLLMMIAFVIGMVELIIGGILDLIANDLNITLGQAGFLITIFSLIFAIMSPILLVMTAKMERKKLMMISLFIFLIGNVITVFSSTYSIVFLGRVISATSGALLIILCLVMSPGLVERKYRARAIGLVSMGVSGAIVLGVPFGILIGNTLGWRAPFVVITILTLISMLGVYFLMEKVTPTPPVPIKDQLKTLQSPKIVFAHATTFLYMTGHTALYAYLKPFLQASTSLDGTWISVIYFAFGFAAVSGGGIGGTLGDLFGTKQTIVFSLIIFGIIVYSIPYMTFNIPLLFAGVVIWGVLSWAISPAMQSYLIETSPETSDTQQSLSNSSLHFGVAFGSFLGGIIIEQTSVNQNALIGSILIAFSLVTAYLSIKSRYSVQTRKEWQGE